MEIKFKPLLDNVLVREIPFEDYRLLVTGLETPDKFKIESDRGEVVAVGDGVCMGGVMVPMPLKVGDIVQYDEFSRHERLYLHPQDRYKPDLPKYFLIRVADIQGIHSA